MSIVPSNSAELRCVSQLWKNARILFQILRLELIERGYACIKRSNLNLSRPFCSIKITKETKEMKQYSPELNSGGNLCTEPLEYDRSPD